MNSRKTIYNLKTTKCIAFCSFYILFLSDQEAQKSNRKKVEQLTRGTD